MQKLIAVTLSISLLLMTACQARETAKPDTMPQVEDSQSIVTERENFMTVPIKTYYKVAQGKKLTANEKGQTIFTQHMWQEHLHLVK